MKQLIKRGFKFSPPRRFVLFKPLSVPAVSEVLRKHYRPRPSFMRRIFHLGIRPTPELMATP